MANFPLTLLHTVTCHCAYFFVGSYPCPAPALLYTLLLLSLAFTFPVLSFSLSVPFFFLSLPFLFGFPCYWRTNPPLLVATCTTFIVLYSYACTTCPRLNWHLTKGKGAVTKKRAVYAILVRSRAYLFLLSYAGKIDKIPK